MTVPDWPALPDDEITELLAGRRITWRNSISGATEAARLLAHDAQQTKVVRYVRADGRKVRTIEFVSAGPSGAFRAVRLRAIRTVSR